MLNDNASTKSLEWRRPRCPHRQPNTGKVLGMNKVFKGSSDDKTSCSPVCDPETSLPPVVCRTITIPTEQTATDDDDGTLNYFQNGNRTSFAFRKASIDEKPSHESFDSQISDISESDEDGSLDESSMHSFSESSQSGSNYSSSEADISYSSPTGQFHNNPDSRFMPSMDSYEMDDSSVGTTTLICESKHAFVIPTLLEKTLLSVFGCGGVPLGMDLGETSRVDTDQNSNVDITGRETNEPQGHPESAQLTTTTLRSISAPPIQRTERLERDLDETCIHNIVHHTHLEIGRITAYSGVGDDIKKAPTFPTEPNTISERLLNKRSLRDAITSDGNKGAGVPREITWKRSFQHQGVTPGAKAQE